MPPKSKAKLPTKTSNSKDLITLGPRHVTERRSGRRDAECKRIERPTTTRALILRNGKHGARGTGEVVAVTRLIGREKLDLLAEDMMKEAAQAVAVPFSLEICLKIAESQFSSYLDDITNLKDPDLFQVLIDEELKARTKVKGKTEDEHRDPAFIASTISVRIHNAYLLASAWKIVADLIFELQAHGLRDADVREQMKDIDFRSRYLVLYDMVNILVNLCQNKFATLATTSPHYQRYFKTRSTEHSEEVVFDHAELREACKSFLDSIIIELCFPHAPYPKAILYRILHDAVEEAPKEAKRFPQSMWNAVGDLSVTVQLQEMIESPLLGHDTETTPRNKPKAYSQWLNAEIMSDLATDQSEKLEGLVSPLSKVSSRTALDNVWKQIKSNYMGVCNKEPDALWQLSEALKPVPTWSYSLVPRRAKDVDSDTDDSDEENGLRKLPGRVKRKPLAITDGFESDDSMPALQDVSESDESGSEFSASEDDDAKDDDESEYDTEEEYEIRDMLHEAIDIAISADWLNNSKDATEIDEDAKKGNPFLKLLGSLRGRRFNANPKLSSRPSKSTAKKPTPAQPQQAQAKSTKTTVEDVEDEDDVEQGSSSKKKKKKPKKKKKKPAAPTAAPAPPTAAPAPEPVTVPVPPPPATPSPAKKTPPKTNPVASQAFASTTLIPPVGQTLPQSGRAYAANMEPVKQKVKSRSDAPAGKEGRGVLSRLGIGRKQVPPESKSTRRSWFQSMGKKTKLCLHQILNTSEDVTKGSAGMKWDTFVKVMKDVGFVYVPNTAGSSVRFDPPSKTDRSITFHKPHPDSFIHTKMLKEFSKKLRKYYDWTPEDLDGY